MSPAFWRTLLAGAFSLSMGVAAAQDISLPNEPLEGARVFEEMSCARCHSVGVATEDRIGPALGRMSLRVSFLDAFARMWNASPSMERTMREQHVQRPVMTGAQLVDLIAFASTNQYYLSRLGRAGNPERGSMLFELKGCAGCHRIGGNEDSIGPDLTDYGSGTSVLEVAQAMLNHSPGMQKEIETRVRQRPHFRPSEMSDLLSYLASTSLPEPVPVYIEPGSPRRGAQVFRERGCIQCHSIRGQGGDRAPDLGKRPRKFIRDYADVAAVMWNHAVPMWDKIEETGIDLPKLEGSDLADLVAYLFFINYVDPPGDPASGEQIFARRGCGSCHDTTGPEGSGRPYEGTAELLAAMWRGAPMMYEALQQQVKEWPTFEDGEMADLASWLLQQQAFTLTWRPGAPP